MPPQAQRRSASGFLVGGMACSIWTGSDIYIHIDFMTGSRVTKATVTKCDGTLIISSDYADFILSKHQILQTGASL